MMSTGRSVLNASDAIALYPSSPVVVGPNQLPDSEGNPLSDNSETIITFIHEDGRTIDIDHLGICSPENRGEFALYEGDRQIGEFMLDWAIYNEDVKVDYELPDDEELIAQAKLSLADDPRVLTQSGVADALAVAAGVIDVDLDAPPSDR